MFHIIGSIIIGFLAGLIARALHPGNDKLGFLMTALLGIGGAFVAQLLGRMIGWYHDGEPVGFVASVLGAVLVLFVYGLITRRSRGGA